MNNKYKAISDWLLNYTPIGNWLYFNVTNVELDNSSLNSVSGPRYLNRFIDGSVECELGFTINLVKSYDTGTSDTNLEALEECHKLMKWCEDQVRDGNLPVFDNCIVNSLEILQDTPSLAVDEDQSLARYQIQGQVNYLELKGDN